MESCLNPANDHGVDWSAPWLTPICQLGMQLAHADDWRGELNRLAQQMQLRNRHHLPLQFVVQQELPVGTSYESFIHETGKVPTRDNLHDFFNALIWLTFPQIKAQLNALQAAQIAHLGVGKSRGPSRDAATLFDENAALLAVTDNQAGHALVAALRNHQWQQIFVTQRAQFKNLALVVLFGHAIIEKLVQPYKAITAHTVVCWVDPGFHHLPADSQRTFLDLRISSQLEAQPLLPALFSPLPILGVPDWWPVQDSHFYADTSVFRAARQRHN